MNDEQRVETKREKKNSLSTKVPKFQPISIYFPFRPSQEWHPKASLKREPFLLNRPTSIWDRFHFQTCWICLSILSFPKVQSVSKVSNLQMKLELRHLVWLKDRSLSFVRPKVEFQLLSCWRCRWEREKNDESWKKMKKLKISLEVY